MIIMRNQDIYYTGTIGVNGTPSHRYDAVLGNQNAKSFIATLSALTVPLSRSASSSPLLRGPIRKTKKK